MKTSLFLMFAALFGCSDGNPGGMSPDAPAATAPGCEAPTGPGTEHSGPISVNETWTAATSPHIVTFGISITNATLTIEPCAVVRIRKGFMITVGATSGATAAIVAHGESIDNPGASPTIREVTFERADPALPWGAIRAFPTGRIDFEHVRLSGGADPQTAQGGGGTIVGAGPGGNMGLTRNVRLVNVTVENSAGFGVNIQTRAAFTADSTNLVIRGSGSMPPNGNIDTRFPITVDGAAVSTIPTGTYTGNTLDAIRVANSSSLLDSEIAFRARGVPYHIDSDFSMSPMATMAAGGLSTLTIEAGVTIKLPAAGAGNIRSFALGASNGGLPVNIAPVRLNARGTAAEPIVLTSSSATPAAGDWAGLEWHGGPPDGNIMSYVRIEYAGGDSGTVGFGCGDADNDAALIIRNWRPDDVFITNSTFSNSAGGGIVSGWQSDAAGPSLVSNNTFTAIGNGCTVSRWRNANGSCIATPPVCL